MKASVAKLGISLTFLPAALKSWGMLAQLIRPIHGLTARASKISLNLFLLFFALLQSSCLLVLDMAEQDANRGTGKISDQVLSISGDHSFVFW
jgi:hypothetical protein